MHTVPRAGLSLRSSFIVIKFIGQFQCSASLPTKTRRVAFALPPAPVCPPSPCIAANTLHPIINVKYSKKKKKEPVLRYRFNRGWRRIYQLITLIGLNYGILDRWLTNIFIPIYSMDLDQSWVKLKTLPSIHLLPPYHTIDCRVANEENLQKRGFRIAWLRSETRLCPQSRGAQSWGP